jgi:DNA polymerase III epsilon subunit-like protein
MRVLYFDTETTGLPKTRESATKGPDNWPHLVSIAWILDDGIKKTQNYYVVKPKWVIPADSTAIHGITQEYADTNGMELSEVMDKFISENADVLVAHNSNFDFNVLMNAIIWDLRRPCPIFPRVFCTMEASRSICRIPVSYSKTKYKPPKLSELYQHVFNRSPPGVLHNSLYDVLILVEIVEATPLLKSMIGLVDKTNVITENESTKKRLKTFHI